MVRFGEHRLPTERIWVVAYTTDIKTEVVEIRTVEPAVPVGYVNLWRREYSLGTSLADFYHADLQVLKERISQIKQQLRAEDPSSLFPTALFFLDQSGIYAPLAAALERYHLVGAAQTIETLERMVAMYERLQPQIAFTISNCFETEKAERLTAKYLNLRAKHTDQMPLLRYGPLHIEVGRCGGNIPLPYDDTTAQFSDMPLEIGEYFTTESLHTEEPLALTCYLLTKCLRENMRYRKCKYCGKYFGLTTNHKSEYCERLIPGLTKTCKEAGAIRLYEKRQQENPANKEYQRSYKAHNARIRYGLMTKEEFSVWSKEARSKRDLCNAGELSLEEFVAWLDQDKM